MQAACARSKTSILFKGLLLHRNRPLKHFYVGRDAHIPPFSLFADYSFQRFSEDILFTLLADIKTSDSFNIAYDVLGL